MSIVDDITTAIGTDQNSVRNLLARFSLPIVLILLFCVFFSIVIVPLGFAAFGALWSAQPWERQGYLTLANFRTLFRTPGIVEVFWNTIIVSFVSTSIAMFGGVSISLLVTRSKIPYRKYLSMLTYVPYILPGYLVAIGWIFLMSPERGIINQWIASTFGSPIPFYNEWWIGIIVGTHYMPLVYFLAAPGIEKIDSTLESASFVHGGNLRETLQSITLPLSKPAMLSTLIIVFIKGFEEFAIALWIGLPSRTFVLSTKIFNAIKFTSPPEYGPSTALALLLVAGGILLLTAENYLVGSVEQYQTVGGQDYSTDRVYDWGPKGNKLIAFFVFGLLFVLTILPILVLVYGSFATSLVGLTMDFTLQNYVTALTYPGFVRSLTNTAIISIVGPTLLMVSAFFSSYMLFKTELPGRRLLDYIMFLPLATPSIVTAIGFLWAFLFFFADFLPLYGSLLGIIVALMGRYVPYATRAMHSGMAGIDDVLEEAALVSGGTPLENLKDIIAPLVSGSFAYGYILLAMFFVKNFTVVVFLYGTGSETISIMIWNLWTKESLWGATAAVAVIMLLMVLVLAALAIKLGDVDLAGT